MNFIINQAKDFAGFIRSLSEDWIGKAVSFFLAACAVAVLIVMWLTFDSWTLEQGKIVSRGYSPAWIQIMTHNDGKIFYTYPIFHPESWSVTISGKDFKGVEKTRSVGVSKAFYMSAQDGQEIKITGAFSGATASKIGLAFTAFCAVLFVWFLYLVITYKD